MTENVRKTKNYKVSFPGQKVARVVSNPIELSVDGFDLELWQVGGLGAHSVSVDEKQAFDQWFSHVLDKSAKEPRAQN